MGRLYAQIREIHYQSCPSELLFRTSWVVAHIKSEDDVNSDTSIASAYHDAPETQLLILHPSSHHIFDSYCHPAWLTPSRRRKYDNYREEHGDEEEEWTRKVLLKDQWLWRCIEAGRFLVCSPAYLSVNYWWDRERVMVGLDAELEGELFIPYRGSHRWSTGHQKDRQWMSEWTWIR